ncbi:MAG: potassium transporter [Acidobacteria bacterium]|nr:potassium transporter [Acidobacteriota bacterium]
MDNVPDSGKASRATGAYLVLGAGHFGRRAARVLLDREPGARVVVVDREGAALRALSRFPVETVRDDGIAVLGRFLAEGPAFGYVVPALPLHVAFECLLAQARPLGGRREAVPELPGLPNPLRGPTGDLYTSLADFRCPEDCPAPARCCTVTGKRRRRPLHRILATLEGPFVPRVIHSRQLAPGVGGFPPGDLARLIREIRQGKNRGDLFLVSTASRCHGVTSALSLKNIGTTGVWK